MLQYFWHHTVLNHKIKISMNICHHINMTIESDSQAYVSTKIQGFFQPKKLVSWNLNKFIIDKKCLNYLIIIHDPIHLPQK